MREVANMTELEIYKRMNSDIKEFVANNLSQEEALKKIMNKYELSNRLSFKLKIIIAVGYYLQEKEIIKC